MEVPVRGRALAAVAGARQYWCHICGFERSDDELQHDKFHKELDAKARAKDAERSSNQKKKNARTKKNKHGKKKGGKKGGKRSTN
jgi:hypothetical protein